KHRPFALVILNAGVLGDINTLDKVETSHISVVFSEEVFKNEEVLKNKIVEIMEAKVKTIENIILEGQNNNEFRTDIEHKILATIIIGTLRFMIKHWDLKNQHKHLKEESRNIVNALKILLIP
ncbi:MAG TPA: hypothetical protein EYP87_07235, partial [Flavobacteriaceae bacterium]|nr:hypothetical protein [Flavobacteriaceae bacterium]